MLKCHTASERERNDSKRKTVHKRDNKDSERGLNHRRTLGKNNSLQAYEHGWASRKAEAHMEEQSFYGTIS
jgi:hypothetical protein